MGNLEISHNILLAGSDFESCSKRVSRFFDRTMLIRYDKVIVLERESINGAENEFRTRLQEGLAANREVVGELLESLKDEGVVTLEGLQGLEKGYLSKILHTIAHLQDGFIGIDSCLYNLEEDSHGISPDLQQQIAAAPDNYWILKVKGIIASVGDDSLDALRTFEWKGKTDD